MDESLINAAHEDSSRRTPPQQSVLYALLAIIWVVFLQNIVSLGSGLLAFVLLARYADEATMAAFGLGNTLCNLGGYFIILGVASGLDTLASQAWGAKNPRAVGLYGQRALLILLVFVCAPLTVVWWYSDAILVRLGQPASVAAHTAYFARVTLPGLYARAVGIVLSKLFVACSKPRPVMYTSVLSELLIGVLFVLLIVRYRMGLRGAALANVVSSVAQPITLLGFALWDREMRGCWPGLTRGALQGWGSYLRLGAPACFMLLAEALSWDLVSFLAGLCHTATGAVPDSPKAVLAAQGLLQSTIALCYCVPFAILRAGGTVIGNAVGAGDAPRARRAARCCLLLGLASSAALVTAIVLLREPLVRLYGAPAAVGAIVRRLIPYLSFFLFADCMQMNLSGVISGAGKQRITGPILVVAYWLLGLPAGAFAAFKPPWGSPRLGLLGLWLGMTLAVYCHFLSYLAICFGGARGRCGVRGAILWDVAVAEAQKRLEEEQDRTTGGAADGAGHDSSSRDGTQTAGDRAAGPLPAAPIQ